MKDGRGALQAEDSSGLGERDAAGPASGPSQDVVNELIIAFTAGRYAHAEVTARQITQTWPHHGLGWKVLGAVLTNQRRQSEALPVLEKVLALMPADVDAHKDQGNALAALGALEKAVASYRCALAIRPDHAEILNNLGNALKDLGKLDEAAASYQRALAIAPEYAEIHSNLSIALVGLGKFDEALASCQRALAIKPDFAAAFNNQGNALEGLGRRDEALASYQRALAIKPDHAGVHCNLGNALGHQGRLDEALASYRRAVALQPDFAYAHNNLGNALKDLGNVDEAIASYRRALGIAPDDPTAHSNLIFTLNYQPDQTAVGLLAEAENYGRRVASKAHPFSAWPVTPDPSRRLRVGWVSGDLKNHPVSFFLQSFLPELSGEQVELYAYQTHVNRDAHTQRFKPLFAVWRPVYGLSDEQLARAIFDDAIDILIDLSGHTANNRLPVFAWKPAPVQVSWLGYFGTTGVPGMDYVLGDPYVTPPEDAAHFSETIWRLPETHLCFTAPDVALDVTPLPALRNGFITFGCFNNLAKMNDAVVAVWAKVLAAVPGSKLFLKAPALNESSVREHVVQRFAGLGVAADRLILEGSSPRAEMLEAYGRVDFALDPFPYPGGTVSMEALWMGVPVLTRRGDRFWSRVGEGIARKAGLADWVAADDEDYVKRAASHAAQVSRLSELRAGLRARVLASPMFDAPRFARHFEAALRGMWQRWVSATSGPSQAQLDHLTAVFSDGRYEEGEAAGQQMIQAWPNQAAGWKALGVALAAQWRLAEALPILQKALALSPSDPELHNKVGIVLMDLGRTAEAEGSYRRALALSPDYAEAHNNLGNALQGLGQLDEAVRCFWRALELKRDYPLAHINLGSALVSLGRLQEAEASYRRALELKPDYREVHSNVLFALNYTGRLTRAELFAEHLAWARRHEEQHAAQCQPHSNARDPRRRLRVGYVSPDFRGHSVAFFIEPVLAAHDRSALEVYCYSNVVNPDNATHRLLGLADRARSIVGMSDASAAELVRGDGIDILVDLAGHTANGRLGLFALKPAPVQVTYLGYPNTTGMSAIEWRLTDAHADPPGEGDAFYSERLVRLPETFLCYQPPAEAPAVQPPPVLETGRVTFGSFNMLAKVTPEVIGAWAGLIERVPGSRLMIKALGLGDSLGREQLLGEFGKHGVSGERLILCARDAGHAAHIARYHEVDIALDPFPYNGTTTTFDALWMGVPVVSLAGERHAARVGASILANLGLEELIAYSVEDYLTLAAALAADVARLTRLRETMRTRMSASPLLDGVRLTRHIEAAYREMWRRWCANEPAAAFNALAA